MKARDVCAAANVGHIVDQSAVVSLVLQVPAAMGEEGSGCHVRLGLPSDRVADLAAVVLASREGEVPSILDFLDIQARLRRLFLHFLPSGATVQREILSKPVVSERRCRLQGLVLAPERLQLKRVRAVYQN